MSEPNINGVSMSESADEEEIHNVSFESPITDDAEIEALDVSEVGKEEVVSSPSQSIYPPAYSIWLCSMFILLLR